MIELVKVRGRRELLGRDEYRKCALLICALVPFI